MTCSRDDPGRDGQARAGHAGPDRARRAGGLVATGADALDGDIHATYAAPDGGRAPDTGRTLELLSAWDAQADADAALVRDDPRAGRLLITLSPHEHDLRGALDCPERAPTTWSRSPSSCSAASPPRGCAPRRSRAPPDLRAVGLRDRAAPGHAILVADRFELFRGFTGRRSAAEVRRWMWSGDPGPYLPYLSDSGSLRATDLDEPIRTSRPSTPSVSGRGAGGTGRLTSRYSVHR